MTARPKARQFFTTYDVARFSGSNPSAVQRWLEKGLLRGWKTPGGHARFGVSELRAFLGGLGMPIPPELGGTRAQLRAVVAGGGAEPAEALAAALRRERPRWEVLARGSVVDALLDVDRLFPDVLVFGAGLTDLDPEKLVAVLSKRGQAPRCIVATGAAPSSPLGKQLLAAGARLVVPEPVRARVLARQLDAVLGLRFLRARPKPT